MAELKKSEINIEVLLDENRVPEELYWSAEDGNVNKEEAKAMMLSMWDAKSQETLRIDLWNFFTKPFSQ
jgi:gliding motility-associated protein GldC